MVIDIHTHIFPDRVAQGAVTKLAQECDILPHTDGTYHGLVKSMSENSIGISVVQPVATKPSQVRSVNDFSANINGKEGIIAFGGIHPEYEDWKEELKRIKSLGLLGIKLHPDYQNAFIDDYRFVDIIKECGRLGLIVLTHAGVDIGIPEVHHCTPERVRSILPEIKGAVLICAHYGGHEYFKDAEKYLADTDVYIDTSYSHVQFGSATCKRVLEAFDEDRILFGSDSPWTNQGDSAAFIKSLGFSEEKTEKILSGNAKSLLGVG